MNTHSRTISIFRLDKSHFLSRKRVCRENSHYEFQIGDIVISKLTKGHAAHHYCPFHALYYKLIDKEDLERFFTWEKGGKK